MTMTMTNTPNTTTSSPSPSSSSLKRPLLSLCFATVCASAIYKTIRKTNPSDIAPGISDVRAIAYMTSIRAFSTATFICATGAAAVVFAVQSITNTSSIPEFSQYMRNTIHTKLPFLTRTPQSQTYSPEQEEREAIAMVQEWKHEFNKLKDGWGNESDSTKLISGRLLGAAIPLREIYEKEHIERMERMERMERESEWKNKQ